MHKFFMGLTLGFSLIGAIGAQNFFLIRQGIKREHEVLSALMCGLSDTTLILLGVTGVGQIITHFPVVKIFLLIAGVLFLLFYGASTFYRAIKNQYDLASLLNKSAVKQTKKVIVLALSFSLLNPHAILDTVVLVGGVANQYHVLLEKVLFVSGVISASFIWFFGIILVARQLANLFNHPKTWQYLDWVSGVLMWGIAVHLARGFWA